MKIYKVWLECDVKTYTFDITYSEKCVPPNTIHRMGEQCVVFLFVQYIFESVHKFIRDEKYVEYQHG